MLTLEHGTTSKKKVLETVIKWRETYLLLDDRKAAGADATGMQTKAELDGDEWVLNGVNGSAPLPALQI